MLLLVYIAMVRRNFKKLDAEDFLLIYKTYNIRQRLEFCIAVMVSVVKLPLHYKTALYFNALVYTGIFVCYCYTASAPS